MYASVLVMEELRAISQFCSAQVWGTFATDEGYCDLLASFLLGEASLIHTKVSAQQAPASLCDQPGFCPL